MLAVWRFLALIYIALIWKRVRRLFTTFPNWIARLRAVLVSNRRVAIHNTPLVFQIREVSPWILVGAVFLSLSQLIGIGRETLVVACNILIWMIPRTIARKWTWFTGNRSKPNFIGTRPSDYFKFQISEWLIGSRRDFGHRLLDRMALMTSVVY